MKEVKFLRRKKTGWPVESFFSFTLVAGLLTVVHTAEPTPRPMLLLERFLAGWGWLEIPLVALYAGWLARRMATAPRTDLWRSRFWRFFSFVFFAQILAGLLINDMFLMTGKLHLPVPALILAGPIYRGTLSFMLILFLVTIVLVGPAWCSHLCYVGAWDDIACRRKRRLVPLSSRRPIVQTAIFIGVIGGALLLRLAGFSSTTATLLAATFGVMGIVVMVVSLHAIFLALARL